ncbi:sulfite exporter TauE/SafE family protein [Flavobacterium agrisoli]|uniref:Probable membrane transporter protein n=1 Tax=Flavobacterium agrisoli TaxID=2793066 RepID=A0A934PKJ9_9FLAO|nr:sulfite exporter TauE/SafE family protein [Flavobacterium agrisoli]MBK0369307.1 sulfite exporter TauE/SafE family protein [Flavobacterium agrisoli]
MTVLFFTLAVLVGAVVAGFVGSLSGLGGGIVIIPLLTLLLGVDIHYAIGAALVSVVATSTGAAAAYVKEGIANIRLGIFLEISTTLGAIVGALLSAVLPTSFIAIVFGLTLLFSAFNSLRRKQERIILESSLMAQKLQLAATYQDHKGKHIPYGVQNVVGGFTMMGVAGMMSGLLGIGSGAFKVIAMDTIMKIPFKVSTTTSNFMMGVTAMASALIYIQKGYVVPAICMPVVIGVLLGALLGTRVLLKTDTQKLKVFFAVLIMFLALNMIYNGFTGKI